MKKNNLSFVIRFLKKNWIIYFIGILVGITITLFTLMLFINIKSQEIQNFVQPKISHNKNIKSFALDNKDYILAGILLNPDNKTKIDTILKEKNISQKEFENYLNIFIFPIYKESIKQFLSKYSLSDIFSKLSDFIKTKLSSIDFNKIISSFKSKIKIFLNSKKNILNTIKSSSFNKAVEIIKNSDFYIKINSFISSFKIFISNLFEDTDDDYHFNTFTINNQNLNLSFLNYLDLYIDLDTISYDDNNSPLIISDDILIISDIYINFESLDTKGIDLILGTVQISGSYAFLLYPLLGVINENI